jgi:ComF family protein
MLSDLLSLLFPEYCYACHQGLVKGESYVCTDCRIKLPYTNLHLATVENQNLVSRRFWGRVPVRYVLPYFYFRRAGRVQRLLHELKYRGAEDLGEALGSWYGSDLKSAGYEDQFDVVIPVPLHRRKQRQRGYNQAESFAKGLARELDMDCNSHVLIRQKDSDTQTRRSREERWQNVEGIFRVVQPEAVTEKRILLADDIITTGATLEACAMALLKAGCKDVSVVSIAAAE